MLAVQNTAEPIPGYQLLERLGQGGFGEVWKARAPGGIMKAIKIVHGCLHGNEADEVCVRQELKALERVKSVRHPYILSLERYDIIDGQLFIVMELADRSLWERYQECRNQGLAGIPRDELLRYMEETAEALDLMNQEYQLQHLDIKPQNLFLLYNHIKVGDFGLVKGLEGMNARVTSGVTPVYAAPETFDGLVSRFSDQYNLGIVYQELLTGQLPFTGKTAQQWMMQHLKAVPNLESLPVEDRAPIGRALSKKPEERHPCCSDLVRALRYANGSVLTGSPFVAPPAAVRPPSDRERATLLCAPEDEPPRKAQLDNTVANRHSAPECPEKTGDGVLFPALVVGLGGAGLAVLQQLRAALHKRVGPVEYLPHIRLLNIDTDPEALTEAAQGLPEVRVREKEILLARLQRPTHYLKPGHEQQAIQSWFPILKLKALSRDQVTTGGWRALGRLALATNYSTIAARMRIELAACANPEALAEAMKRTGLDLRSDRPRIYIVTHLGGGTGSGMFLDLAYGFRSLLSQLGYRRAEIIGVLLLPPSGRQASAQGMANAHAALTEMSHFSQGAEFTASYLHHTDPLHEAGSAFSRCFVLPMSAEGGVGPMQELTALAGDFLCRDLASVLGRTVDGCRARDNSKKGGLSAFGSYWFTVPHRLLLQRVAQQFCQSMLQSWQNDVAAQEREKRAWIDEQLQRWQLMPERVTQRLEEACTQNLGRSAAEACSALLARWAPGGEADLGRDPTAASKVFKEIEQLAGTPSGSGVTVLGQALATAAEPLAAEADGHIAEITLAALSEPKFRLAGASGGIVQRQLGEALVEQAKKHQASADEQFRKAAKLCKSMKPLIDTLGKRLFLGWGQKSRAARELLDWLNDYLGACCQGLLLRQVGRVYQELHDNLHKHQREVGCCWPRIRQFLQSFDDAAKAAKSHVELGLGQYLLPPGCQTLEEGAAQVLGRLTREELHTLHERVHDLLARHLQQHLHLCTVPAQFFKDLQEVVYREVASITESQLTKAHAAELYVQQHSADPAVLAELATAFEEAAPQLSSRSSGEEISILAVPPGPEGEYFRGLVQQALPGQEFVNAASTDDIVFYREQSNLSLSDLPQAGPSAQEAYQRLLAGEHFSPHARMDINWRVLRT